MEDKIVINKNGPLLEVYKKKDGKIKVRYNLKKKRMEKLYKDDIWRPVVHQYEYFQGYRIIDIESDEEKFMNMIQKTKRMNPSCTSVSTFLARLDEALVYENYEKEGIRTECDVMHRGIFGFRKDVLTKPLEFYGRNVQKFIKENDIKVTTNFEGLFINDYDFWDMVINKLMCCDITSEQKRTIIDIIQRRDTFERLVKDYNYNIRSLVEYLFNYLQPFENQDPRVAMSDLYDYYRMANTIGRDVKKYPKYLRSMHDIIMANYNAYKKEYDEELFKRLRKDWLDYEGKKFSIVTPEKTNDIISEGTSLNHCVSSYVNRILNQETYIFFLRYTKTKEESLVTLEYQNGTLVQAKGAYNRLPTDEEREFLKKYCKEKKIKYGLNS